MSTHAPARPAARGASDDVVTTPSRRVVDPSDTGRTGTWLSLAVCVGAMAASFVGLASVVQLAFPLVAVAGAVLLLLRRQWYSYLAYTLVVWLLTAEVRRVADWRAGYQDLSLVVISASLVSLVALPWALAGRRRVYRTVGAFFTLAFVVFAYGFVVGVLKNGAAGAAVDVLYLVAPATTGLFVLTVPPDTDRLRRVLQATATWGLVAIGGYAVLQFLVLPPWDAQWMIDSEISSVGRPEPGAFRAFSTMATTGPLGQLMAVFLLLLVAERRRALRFVAGSVGLVALGVTLVRAGWIGLVVGLAVLFWLGRAQLWRVVVPLLVLVVAVGAFGGPIVERVTARATETASSGTEDTSFSARLEFQRDVAPEALSDPVGDGMGSTGRATNVTGAKSEDAKLQNFDTGIFETITRYGAIAGIALLAGLVTVTVGLVRRARRAPLFEAACTAAVVALTLNIVFTDTLRASYGLLLWTLIGFLGRSARWPQRRGSRHAAGVVPRGPARTAPPRTRVPAPPSRAAVRLAATNAAGTGQGDGTGDGEGGR